METCAQTIQRLTRERDQLQRDVAEWREESRTLHDRLSLAMAERDQRSAALAEVVWAMEEWGRWEDGVPCSDEPGTHGRVGKAYDAARMLLGHADDGRRIGGVVAAARDRDSKPDNLQERVAVLERDSALVWELIKYLGLGDGHGPRWGNLSDHAARALDARKAGGG